MLKKILIFDDDEAVLEVLREVLEYANFEVKTATVCDNVFKDIEDFKPDLILMDYILKGINGGEICHQIKSNSKTSALPVILISAYPRVLLSLGDYGSDTFISKPFDLSDLLEKINSCLISPQAI